MRRSISSLVFALVLGAAAARADEKLEAAQVPAKVLRVVEEKYPQAKQLGWGREVEHGKTVYEVKLARGDEKLEVSLTPEGAIAAEETEVAYASVPANVRAAFEAGSYAQWKVRKAERILSGGATSYELALERTAAKGAERAEIVLDGGGKLVSEERSKPRPGK